MVQKEKKSKRKRIKKIKEIRTIMKRKDGRKCNVTDNYFYFKYSYFQDKRTNVTG